MRMRLVRENALFLLEETKELLQGTLTCEGTIELLYELSRLHVVAALSGLLVEADRADMRAHLLKAGDARLWLLRLAREHGLMRNRRCCASLLEPFFGSLVAGSPARAGEIAEDSPALPVEGEEYEEDFLYSSFLHRIVLRKTEGLHELLDQFESASRGAEAARLDVLRGLLDCDQDKFDGGFRGMLEERAAYFEASRGKLPIDIMGYQTRRYVFIEGAALLKLADDVGLATSREYPFIPSLLRA